MEVTDVQQITSGYFLFFNAEQAQISVHERRQDPTNIAFVQISINEEKFIKLITSSTKTIYILIFCINSSGTFPSLQCSLSISDYRRY